MSTRSSSKAAPGALDLLLYSVAIAVGIVIWAISRIVAVFDPAGTPFALPVTDDAVDVQLEGESSPDSRVLTEATVLVPDLDVTGQLFLVVSVVITLVGTLVVVGALIRVALAFRAGEFFARRVTRGLTLIGATVFATALLVMLSDAMARRSAMEALGLAHEPLHMLDLVAFAPAWIAAIVFGVLAGAFAHGERLQRDVRGLV
ncbi:hypothetical protein ACLBXX_16040 [Microbacterium sp. C23T]